MRKLWIALGLAFSVMCHAQSTTVTATITDSDGQTWNNGTVTATFVPTPQGYNWPGGVIPNQVKGTMNGSGAFSISLPDNSTITPTGSAWRFSICPNASAPCVSTQIPVSGSSQNLSTQLSAIAQGPRFPSSPSAYGYIDGEVSPTPLPGGTYFNVTSGLQRLWTGSSWVVNGGGGGGSGSFPAVYPETYGALGNGVTLFDGAMGNSQFNSSSTGTSTTASAPAITTTVPNTRVLSFFLTNAAWSSAPSTGTQRQNQNGGGSNYGMTLNDQLIPSPGSVPAVTGTLSSSTAWIGTTIAYSSGGATDTYVNSTIGLSSSGTTVTGNVPSGVSNGDVMFSCLDWWSQTNTLTPPSGWTQISSTANGFNTLTCYSRVASSEPGSYTWTQTGTVAMTVIITDYRSTASTNSLYSASASFAAGDVGKLICVEQTTVGGGQSCGTISAVNSANNITTSFSSASTALGSGLWFAYATDDYSAFHTMLTTSPCSTVGCAVQLSTKRYGLSASLAVPINVPVSIAGTAPALARVGVYYLVVVPPLQKENDGGSQLLFLTKSLTGAGLSVSGSAGVTSYLALDSLHDFSIVGGVGHARDGGGHDGLDVLNWQGLTVQRVMIANFANDGIYIDGLTASSFNDYIATVSFDTDYVFSNNGCGVQIGGLAGVTDVENVNIKNLQIEGNGDPGVCFYGPSLQSGRLQGSLIQWNNINAANYEISVTGTAAGWDISGNYFELDNALGSQSYNTVPMTPNAAGSVGIHWGENIVNSAGSSRPPIFLTSGLPSCTTGVYVNRKMACVSDATACTNGTTLVGSGSTVCKVQCNTSNWVETGSGGDCF